MAALPDFGGDAREAFNSMTEVVDSQGGRLIPDFERISQAVPNRVKFLGADHDPAVSALENLRGDRAQPAFVDLRREARRSGHLYDEGWALTVFVNVLNVAGRPVAELAARVAAGDGDGAADVAAALPDWADLRDSLDRGPSWAAAAAQALAAEADLTPDDLVDPLVGRLLTAASTAATTPPSGRQPSLHAFRAVASFADRIEEHRVDDVIELVKPHLEHDTQLTDPAIAIVRGLYRGSPARRANIAHLLDGALDQPRSEAVWSAIRALREPDDQLEAIARTIAAGPCLSPN